ncbi:hypothetical protein Goari_026066, partial [Gossypium aridum]|nr:hypothetical protein [Gossypium aridum]
DTSYSVPLRNTGKGCYKWAARVLVIGLVFDLGYIKPIMIDDQDLGFFANFLGIFIFVLVIAYHYVMADPKFEGN